MRITPILNEKYSLSDYTKTSEILKTVESIYSMFCVLLFNFCFFSPNQGIHQSVINETCSFIYASSFYLKPDDDSLEEGRVQFTGTITSRLTGRGRDALNSASFFANFANSILYNH